MTQEKINFANTLADSVSISMNECEKYGMCWGCDEECPVYIRGECEIQEENKKIFKDGHNDIR